LDRQGAQEATEDLLHVELLSGVATDDAQGLDGLGMPNPDHDDAQQKVICPLFCCVRICMLQQSTDSPSHVHGLDLGFFHVLVL
jgi:hypothetical protein